MSYFLIYSHMCFSTASSASSPTTAISSPGNEVKPTIACEGNDFIMNEN